MSSLLKAAPAIMKFRYQMVFFMIILKKVFSGASLLFLALLNACTTTTLKSVWRDTAFDGYITTIMVTGVAARHDIRQFFEKEFVKQFKEAGVEAMASVESIPSEDQLEASAILDEVRKRGIDMIMVTHLVKFDDKSIDPTGGSGGIFQTYYHNVSITILGSGNYDPGIQRTPGVTLMTKIYEAKTEKLVWSAESKSLDPNFSKYDMVKSLSKAIINSLRDNKLLR